MKIKEHEIIVIVLSLTKISIIFKHKRHLYKFVWQVTINITDDNERPFFSQPEYLREIEENTKQEGVFMTVTAQDRKRGNIVECNCTYSLVGVYYIPINK